MRSKTPTAGHGLARLAAAQHGVVARRQMRALGMTERQIAGAVRAGQLHRVFRGVYAVGHPRTSKHGQLRAATLACGKRAVISHRSAGALLGLLDGGPVVIDVIAPGDRGREIDGIRFHRVRAPRREETGTVEGIPCTSPARTLVDLAGTVGDWTLRSCFKRAAQRKYLDIAAIEGSMDPGRRGIGSIRRLVEEWRSAAPVAKKGRLKSPLEAKVLPLVLQRSLPAPLLNAPVQIAEGRIEVDFLWPHHRFALEADSRDFHGTALRVTHHQAETEATAIAETITARLLGGLPKTGDLVF